MDKDFGQGLFQVLEEAGSVAQATIDEALSKIERHVDHALQGGIIFPEDVNMAFEGKIGLAYTSGQRVALTASLPSRETLAAGIEKGYVWLPGPPRIMSFRDVFKTCSSLFHCNECGGVDWEDMDFPDRDQRSMDWYAMGLVPSGMSGLAWRDQVAQADPMTRVPNIAEVAWAMVVCSLVDGLRRPPTRRLFLGNVWARTATTEGDQHVAIGLFAGKIRALSVRDEVALTSMGLAELMAKEQE